MKGSTLRRSNLSREKLAMIEALANYKSKYRDRGLTPDNDKQDKLDFLWQNFEVASKSDKSSMAYFTSGVLVGVVSTLILAIVVSLVIGYSPLDDINVTKTIKAPKEKLSFTFIPADTKQNVPQEEVLPQSKEYTVQAGDSLESISIKFYGGYDEAKIKGIEEANKLSNPNAIGIGQKLIIPIIPN